MNSAIAPSLDLHDRTSLQVEHRSIEALLEVEVTDLSMNELELLSHFLQREIQAIREVLNGELTEEDLLPSTRNILHIMAKDPIIPRTANAEEPDKKDEEEIFRGLARAHSMSVEIEMIEDEDWTTVGYSQATTDELPITHEEFGLEDNTGKTGHQYLITHRLRNLARGKSMTVQTNQIDNVITSPTTSSLSNVSLTESAYAYMSAARLLERNDAQEKFRNPFVQPVGGSAAVEEEISPLNSSWLTSTTNSSEYDGDDEEESVESLEKSVQSFLNMLESELFANEETPSNHKEHPFTPLIILEQKGSSPATNIRAEPFSESEDDVLFDGEDLFEAETDGLERVFSFHDRLEAEFVIDVSKSDNREDATELFVDFDGVHNSPVRTRDAQNRTRIWVQSTSPGVRDQVSRKLFSNYSGYRPSDLVSVSRR